MLWVLHPEIRKMAARINTNHRFDLQLCRLRLASTRLFMATPFASDWFQNGQRFTVPILRNERIGAGHQTQQKVSFTLSAWMQSRQHACLDNVPRPVRFRWASSLRILLRS